MNGETPDQAQGTACTAWRPGERAVPDRPADQAAYMAALAEVIAVEKLPIPNPVLADIAHAVSVIGAAVASAEAAYAAGLKHGKAAAGHAVALAMPGRHWRVGHDSGNVFDDDDNFDGTTLVIELASPAEVRAVATLILSTRGRPDD